VKLVHLVGFIIKKFVTIHGHMKVKKKKDPYSIYLLLHNLIILATVIFKIRKSN